MSATGRRAHLPGTIVGTTVHEIEIKRSRFITTLAHVSSVDEADQLIASVRKQYWDARHNCVAMIVGEHADQQRSSDDGEPSGTAGVPMLEVLRHRSLTDVVAVVTRYFGGVLLGAGGLVRAYTAAVSQTVDTATHVARRWRLPAAIDVDYADIGRFENALRTWCDQHDADFIGIDYATAATLRLAVDPTIADDLRAAVAAISAGNARLDFGELQVVDVVAPKH